MRRGISGVPAFLIGDEMVVGLDRARVMSLVDHRLMICDKCGTKMRVPTGKGKIKVTCSKCGNKFVVST